MTYGETADGLRTALAALMGQHRVLYRLAPELETSSAGYVAGALQAYRRSALIWCREALMATAPAGDVAVRYHPDPLQMRHRLDFELESMEMTPPLSSLLDTRHHSQLLSTWQDLARAAASGELDFDHGVGRGSLTPQQCSLVLKDVGDIAQSIAVLDARYANVAGWTRLRQGKRLREAGAWLSETSQLLGLDDTVRQHGWRPRLERLENSDLQGVDAAIQSQHNLLIELGRVPNALNLRRVLHSQASASAEAAHLASVVAPSLAVTFTDRTHYYRDLLRASRNLGGLLGGGGQAALDSRLVSVHLERTTPGALDAVNLHRLSQLFEATDARLRTVAASGFAERLYFEAVHHPDLGEGLEVTDRLVSTRWQPVPSPDRATLLIAMQARKPTLASSTHPAPDETRETARSHERPTTRRHRPRPDRDR